MNGKKYGITIVSKNSESFIADSLRIAEAWQYLSDQGYADILHGWEIQPDGGKLLHLHVFAEKLKTCRRKNIHFDVKLANYMGVNVKVEELRINKDWAFYTTKTARKSDTDVIWQYQQVHCDLFD